LGLHHFFAKLFPGILRDPLLSKKPGKKNPKV